MLQYIVPLLSLAEFSFGQDISNAEDIKILSELPIDRLLTLKSGFAIEKEDFPGNQTQEDIESRTFPQASALQGKRKIKDRGGHGGGDKGGHYYYEEYYEKENGKKNKIQNIFQLSVTSLAFLAFGGYLLCLLIHAIRAKQNYTAAPAVTQAFTAFVANKVRQLKNKKRPRYKRKNLKYQYRPNTNFQTQKRPNRNLKKLKKPNRTSQQQKKPNGVRNSYLYGQVPKPIQKRPRRDVHETGGFLVPDDYLYQSLVHLSEVYTKFNTFDYLQYNKTNYWD